MKTKQLLFLTLVAALLVGAAKLSTKKPTATGGAQVGSKVLPALAINDIQTLDIRTPNATATVARVDGIWRVVNHHNYPADFGKIRDLLTKLADLKTLQSVRATTRQRRELHLQSDPGIDAAEQPAILDLKDKAGKSMETLLLGKERQRPSASQQPEPYGGAPDGRFIATGKGAIHLVGDTLSEVVAIPRQWMDEDFISVKPEEVSSIEISGTTNGNVVMKRSAGTIDFTLPAIPEDKETDAPGLTRLASALSYIRFDDIADPGTAPGTMGLDKPVTFVAHTFKGETYTVTIGRSTTPDTQYYARFAVAFIPPPAPTGADATNQAAKAQAELNEKLDADTKRLSAKIAPWTYRLNTYAAESFTMGYADLLKDKSTTEEKKPETN
jgi:hypothetical protein